MRNEQCVREASDRCKGRAAVWKVVDREPDPIDAFDDDQNIRVRLQYLVSRLLRGALPICVISRTPVGIGEDIAADLSKGRLVRE
jgi:hypothetical protein